MEFLDKGSNDSVFISVPRAISTYTLVQCKLRVFFTTLKLHCSVCTVLSESADTREQHSKAEKILGGQEGKIFRCFVAKSKMLRFRGCPQMISCAEGGGGGVGKKRFY